MTSSPTRIRCGGAYDFRYVIQLGRLFADVNQAVAQVRAMSYPPLVMRK